jgi:hypothetical protein
MRLAERQQQTESSVGFPHFTLLGLALSLIVSLKLKSKSFRRPRTLPAVEKKIAPLTFPDQLHIA